ncbi:tetratricopeptide repeat protein [bacterium]|nr:tetratricopeptide repeat protein [bacterium]
MIKITGAYISAETVLQSLLNRLPPDDARRIALLNCMTDSAWRQGNYDEGKRNATQAQELATTHDNLQGLADSLKHLGNIADSRGEYTRATDLFQQSLAIKQQLGDQYGISLSLMNLGVIAKMQGEYERATDLFQQSLTIKQQLGEQQGIAMILNNLAGIAHIQEEYTDAINLYQQSLAICQQLGEQRIMCHNFMGQGEVLFIQGNERALHWFSQALKAAHAIGATPEKVWAVVGFAGHLTQQGQAERAAQFAGLAQQHPAQNSEIRRALDNVTPQLEAALSPDDLAAALERGKSLDLDTVVTELLGEFGH